MEWRAIVNMYLKSEEFNTDECYVLGHIAHTDVLLV
jgi:hypothetical protein